MSDIQIQFSLGVDDEADYLQAEARGAEPGVDDPLGDEDAPTPVKYQITSYGADPTVEVLVNRMRTGNYFVPPFQREFVWAVNRSSAFIESLLLGLPVPGIFLSKEVDGNRYLIIDGQQRLKSLLYFFDGVFQPTGKEFALVGVAPQFQGKTYKTLDEDARLALDDAIIHSTIIKQDDPEEEEVSSIYHVFKRINAGAVPLTPQEIRFCISNGAFTDLLKELNNNRNWRELYGPQSKRMKDQELILRFFALMHSHKQYSRPMQSFLDAFLHRNRKLTTLNAAGLQKQFADSVAFIRSRLGERAFKAKGGLNAAVMDSVMVSVAEGLARNSLRDDIDAAYTELLGNEEYDKATSRATADEANVDARLSLARQLLHK